MFINLYKFIPVIFLLSILVMSQRGLAQNDKDHLNNSASVLSPTALMYINEDFSTAVGVSPPAGWSQHFIAGVEGVDLWHFDNPGGRTITSPLASPVAVFDALAYSHDNIAEDAALESPSFDPTASTTVTLEWNQYFNATGGGTGNVEIWNGNSWISVYTVSSTTPPSDFRSIDITQNVSGIDGVKIRFRYSANNGSFWIIDNVKVFGPGAVPNPAEAVQPPDGAIDVDMNTILEWAPGAGSAPTGYRLYFGTDGGGITPPTNIENNEDLLLTTSYLPAAPLLYGLTYYWMVVPYNEEGDAPGNEIWSFTVMTDPPVTTFPYMEDFEGSFPPLYYIRYTGLLEDPITLAATSSGWEQDDWQNSTSPVNKAARINISGVSQNLWLATALIDLGTDDDYQLEFDLTLNASGTSNPPESTGSDDKFAVVVSTDGGATWSTSNIQRLWDNSGSPYVYNNIDYQGEHVTIDLSAYQGLIQIGFYGESNIVNADNDLMIDNVEVIEAPVPYPVFSADPDSLGFGIVGLGEFKTLQTTIANAGTADLILTNIISSDQQFTSMPDTFPITIIPGNEQVFDINFIPDTTGVQFATLQIIHNATGSPFSFSVSGTGADAGPTFNVSPASLDFGTVGLNTQHSLPLTVRNTGLTNTLEISSASVTGSGFSVSPSSASIPAGEDRVFNVTFNPLSVGTYSGNLTFNSNDPSSPHMVALSGKADSESGLTFVTDTVYQLEDDSYIQNMRLKGLDPLGEKVQAIQFRLAVNKSIDDNTILTFQSIQKGTDVAGENWVLDYNLFRGPITGNGASIDSVYILLYNLDQDAGLDPAQDYNNLFTVKYRIADLPALNDTLKSSFIISHATATTHDGYPVDITPSKNKLTIMALNRISSIGDVNGDGSLDILDLIMVVDHIVGRDSLTGDYFTRADISPWIPGTPEPEPDGLVNVQDLSLIQNIILTGVYPDNSLNKGQSTSIPKLAGDPDAKLKLYINNEGISVFIDSKVDIRGAQLEMNNINDISANISISTDLGQGYYHKINTLMRTLLYDRLADKYIRAGEHFVADIPLQLSNPGEIHPEKIILVDMNRHKLNNTDIEIIYGNAPSLPLDFILYQNYPNPFNPSTTVKFQVPQTSLVTIHIYNLIGQEIRTLFSQQVPRGTYTVSWDGKNEAGERMSSGTYIYRIIANDFVQSKKMILLK